MLLNESTAGQIGSEYQKTTGDVAKTAALSTVAVARLLRAILARLQGQREGLVEIRINGKLAFRGKEGEKPQFNKLKLEHLQVLEKIIGASQKELSERSVGTSQERSRESFSVSVDGETVYHSIGGQEKINKFTAPQPRAKPLAPTSQEAPSNAIGLAAAIAAKRVLDSRGVDVYENDVYRLERQQGNMKITAKDGRGEILNWKLENSAGSLTERDMKADDVKALESIAVPAQQQYLSKASGNSVEIERE